MGVPAEPAHLLAANLPYPTEDSPPPKGHGEGASVLSLELAPPLFRLQSGRDVGWGSLAAVGYPACRKANAPTKRADALRRPLRSDHAKSDQWWPQTSTVA